MACLYRHFDRDGKLLYIGVSLSVIGRLGCHKQNSHWFKKIAHIDIDQYSSKEAALIAEKLAIKKENPLHNIEHKIVYASHLEKLLASRRKKKRVLALSKRHTNAKVAELIGCSRQYVGQVLKEHRILAKSNGVSLGKK